MTRPTDLPGQFASLLLRGVLLIAGAVFALAVLAAGLIAAVGVVLWALLRGRWPEMKAGWQIFRAVRSRRPPFAGGMRRPGAAPRGGTVVDAEVVDVEVREIPSHRLPRQP